MPTVSIKVSGKVQGVFFRQSSREKALQLQLAGTVKNETGGDVTIVATGLQENINQLIDWCHQGPPRAMVTLVKVEPMPEQEFDGFTIIH